MGRLVKIGKGISVSRIALRGDLERLSRRTRAGLYVHQQRECRCWGGEVMAIVAEVGELPSNTLGEGIARGW